MAELIALFPLDYVLLPGLPLPLHVFEPRYRKLVADVSAAATGGGHGAFGVVLGHAPLLRAAEPVVRSPRPGTYVSAVRPEERGLDVAEVGTMAEIIENEPYSDGRCDLLTVGSRRFRILAVRSAGEPYLQASVEFLDELDGDVDPAGLARARALTGRYRAALSELTGTHAEDDVATDPLRASYEIASRLQLTTTDRQFLLASADSAERLRAEVGLLRRELALLAETRAVPVPAHTLHVQTGVN